MQNQRTKNNRKKNILIVSILALVIISAVTAYAVTRYPNTFFGTNDTQEEIETNNDSKKDFIENTNPDGSPIDDSPDDTAVNPIEVSAQKENDGSVTVFTKTGSIARGTCELTITNESASLSKQAPVLYQDQYSSCAGFSITGAETSQLGVGDWSIVLEVVDGSNTQQAKTTFNFKAR